MAEATVMTSPVKDPVIKEGVFDITKRVTQITTDKHPFHKADKEIRVSELAAKKNALNGWAK